MKSLKTITTAKPPEEYCPIINFVICSSLKLPRTGNLSPSFWEGHQYLQGNFSAIFRPVMVSLSKSLASFYAFCFYFDAFNFKKIWMYWYKNELSNTVAVWKVPVLCMESSSPSFNEQNNISFLSVYFFISEMLITLMGFLWQDTEINDYFHFWFDTKHEIDLVIHLFSNFTLFLSYWQLYKHCKVQRFRKA